MTEAVEARVRAWLAELGGEAGRPDLLAGVRQDGEAFAFTRLLLESVVSAEDPFAAALGLREASRQLPPSLPTRDRLAMRAGGLASLGLPWAVLPVVRRWLRDRVSHLVLSVRTPAEASRDGHLGELRQALSGYADRGLVAQLRLTGEPVLGPEGAAAEIRRLAALAAEPSVSHLAMDPSRVVPGGDWSFDADAENAARALRPVFEAARDHGTTVVLVASDYRGARLAPELLVLGLADPALGSVRAGLQLAAELPEAHDIAERMIRFSAQRAAEGGLPLEIAVGFGGFGADERIASVLSGLAVPVLDGREAQAAQWLRLIRLVLRAAGEGGGSPTVLPVAASEDPHLLAAALNLAGESGLAGALALQLRAGTATPLAELLRSQGAPVRLQVPLTAPSEFSGAIELLMSLAAEVADPESPLAHLVELLGLAPALHAAIAEAEAGEGSGNRSVEVARFAELLQDEVEAFRRAEALAEQPFPASHRQQLRAREWDPSERDSVLFYRPPADTERFDTGGLTAAVLGLVRGDDGEMLVEPQGPVQRIPHVSASGFANEPDTDAALTQNRTWVRGLLRRAAEHCASDAVPASEAAGGRHADPVEAALSVAEAWRAQPPRERATRLRRLALGTAAARDRLFVEIAAESGAPAAVLDAEVNSAIDAARYLGQLAEGLGALRGAEFRPDPLVLVIAEAGIPLADRAEAVLAALAAGSAVLFAVHPGSARSTAALLEEWRAAGLPDGLVALVIAEDARVEALAVDPRVDRAFVLGDRATARALIRRRPGLRVEGRFQEPGTMLVAPTANPSLAARDAVRSAFGGGSASLHAARAVIVTGPVARSKRLREQLADAVRAIRVGDTADPGGLDPLAFDFGPLPAAPDEAGLRALTELDSGEEWLVQPERLDKAGRLWRPGVRVGLKSDARFWRDATGMPVIGVIGARTFDEALELQRELGGGGVAALHCGTAEELVPWLDRSRAASLVVNRATVPARVERQPSGGWHLAGMGAQTLAGGPNRLVTLGSWKLRPGSRSTTLHLRGLDPEVQVLIEAAQAVLDYENFDRVRRAALSDALTWRTTLGRVQDEIGLGVERNLLRRWPVAAQIRLAENGSLAGLIRVLAAALLVRAPVTLSTGVVLPPEVSEFLASQGVTVSLERDEDWIERIAVEAAQASGDRAAAPMSRVRLIGGDAVRTAEWLGGQGEVAVLADPVTMAGPVELLAFLREQSVSVTAHRYGLVSPPRGLEEWIAELDARSAPPA